MATRPRDESPDRSLPVGDMVWRYDSWESYFYPETFNPVTGDGTLRNLYDEHDPWVLARFEYIETTGRTRELLRGDVAIPWTYVPVFQAVAIEHSRSSTPNIDPAARSRSPLSASYPKPPKQATRPAQGAPGQTPYRSPRGYGHGTPGVSR